MLRRSLKISFLVDDNQGPGCPGEHGLSIFIEADIKILFDAGQSRLFLENAGRLGVDPASVDCLVLSHGHYDHGNGFEFITGKSRIAAVAGGFHLKDGSPAIQPTVDYLMNSGVELLMPCHCVDAAVIRLFNTVFSFEPVFAGKIKEFTPQY